MKALAAILLAATVPRFDRSSSPLALEGPARPGVYLEASGRRAAFLGREDGSFEAWVYPMKILRGFELAFEIDATTLGEAARKTMWTPARNSEGRDLPYALGWFVENAGGTRTIWHYGWFPPTVSTLYVKLPDRKTTLILLANSDGLSAKWSWTADGVRASPFARLFLEHFATGS